jgi:putative pyruvate formate lyase activating enzyme
MEHHEAAKHLERCTLCPRRCGVNRGAGELGFCRAGARPRIARAALHFGEEPCISGERGSGTVFFSHCNLRCAFCQNHQISHDGAGRDISPAELAGTFVDLQDQGAHNINLVSPTPYLPAIVEAVAAARRGGLRVPVVHNSNGYETVEAVALLAGTIDVYLPDFKYGPAGPQAADRGTTDPGVRYSAAPGYFEAAGAAIRAMAAQVGPTVFDAGDAILRGVIVRHLVLPGHVESSKAVLRWMKENLPTGPGGVLLSLMSQYTPMYQASRYPEISRRLTLAEYAEVLDLCASIDLTEGYAQDLKAAGKTLIPKFDLTGVPRPAPRPPAQGG